MAHPKWRAVGVGAVAGYAALQWLGRSYGSTAAERRRPLPGDDLTRDPLAVTTHRHLPPGWHDRFGAWIDWTWAFVLVDLRGGRTRLVVRSRFRAGPWWVAAAYLLGVVPADFVMARQMLHGIAARAERGGIGRAAPAASARAVA